MSSRFDFSVVAALAALAVVTTAACSGRSNTSDDTGNTGRRPTNSEADAGCRLDELVEERVATSAIDCSSVAREELGACVGSANREGKDAYWLGPERATLDSTVQEGLIVYADGSVESFDWDSDPTGTASYVPTATVARCPSLAEDPNVVCENPDAERTLCSFGVRL